MRPRAAPRPGARRVTMPSPAAALRVGGLVPFTQIDFPGRLSAVVFVQGCPWRCAYCHNPHLQARDAMPERTWADVLEFLARRTGLLDAVVFSGGEPTIDPALPRAIDDVRALGMKVGIHSAGMAPRPLAAVLPGVDWIGLDVKAPLDDRKRHDLVTGVRGDVAKVRESVQAVLRSGARHEFRTTAHLALLDDAALLRIGRSLASMGARAYALQVARPVTDAGVALATVARSYPAPATLKRLADLFESFVVRRD